jgi:hypothetical protein
MIYRRHDPPPPPKPVQPRPAAENPQSEEALAYQRGVIRRQTDRRIAELRKPGVPQRTDAEISAILDAMEAVRCLDGFTCHENVERLAVALLSPRGG